VREYLRVTAYGKEARRVILDTCVRAARTRDDLADLINMALEELVRQRYELPAFSTLLRMARTARHTVNRDYQARVCEALDADARQRLLAILRRPEGESRSLWDRIKREPKRPTVLQLKECFEQLRWLQQLNRAAGAFADIPEAKIRQFAAEARSLDLASLNDMPERKRLTLTAALILKQVARTLDDLVEMFLRQVRRMHHKAEETLALYRTAHTERADALIARLRDITLAYKAEGSRDERWARIDSLLGKDVDQILAQCTAHGSIASNSHLAFLLGCYSGRRSTLFLFLRNVFLVSTTQDPALQDAIAFLLGHSDARGHWIPITTEPAVSETPTGSPPYLDLSFVPDKWWPLVTGDNDSGAKVARVHRRYFELCVLTETMQALKSGDLCLPGSEQYSDYRTELISEEEYRNGVALYGEQAGIPVEGPAFTTRLREQLETAARTADEGFPDNDFLQIENGEPALKRLQRKPEPAGRAHLDQRLTEHMTEVGILDVLTDTEHWLDWTRFFGPISGHDMKLDNPHERYLLTTFCYGCDLGPTQTARSIKSLDRRQVSFVNQRHISEETLNQAITAVVNAYAEWPLQRVWGTGQSASADGTQWEMSAQTMMSEYHLRYGGYGGIGYYLIADSYIALYSRFSTCGAWEGHYILDFVEENESDVQPDTVHADTQGQSTAIFGLAYLLGIQLMPRIRHWKTLTLCRPDREVRYTHIDPLFRDTTDWDLIERMLPDMLRVALSIKAGTILPSTILRRLATYSRKNKLYFAFRELGRVVRTIFLLNYISSVELRHVIQAATNKSEAFNRFVQWVSFGGAGILSESTRDEQRKFIKYNHLVANLVAFHTLVTMTRALHEIEQEGHPIDLEALATFDPYRVGHINRFGDYAINPNRQPEPLERYLAFRLPAVMD
jgi:TnpA family transposase